MEDYLYYHRKKIMVVIAIILVIVVGISTFFIVRNNIYSATVELQITPSIAKVKIGDETYQAMKTHKIKPGEYEVEVSAEGFGTKTGSLKAVAGETVTIRMFLEPTDDNSSWYDEHEDDALILGEIKNSMTIDSLEKLREKNAILNQLPITIDYFTNDYSKRVRYTIDYEVTEDGMDYVIVIHDYSGGNYEDALNKLRARGAKVEKDQVKYLDESMDDSWGHAG